MDCGMSTATGLGCRDGFLGTVPLSGLYVSHGPVIRLVASLTPDLPLTLTGHEYVVGGKFMPALTVGSGYLLHYWLGIFNFALMVQAQRHIIVALLAMSYPSVQVRILRSKFVPILAVGLQNFGFTLEFLPTFLPRHKASPTATLMRSGVDVYVVPTEFMSPAAVGHIALDGRDT
jgi:hypothetical protein